ncbi:hypothetical protein JOM56_002585 [Amanita muscaria]
MATPTWHALAAELIFEILRYARPELIPVLNPRDFPWHLGHICSSWRAVFVSSSQFWNTLSIDLDSKAKDRKIDPRPYEHALDIVNVCVQRSKSRPLKFTYWMTLPVLYSSKQRTRVSRYCRSILAVLVAHSERWQDIDLSIGPPQLATLYSVRNKLPKLESVRLFLYPQYWVSKKLKQLREDAQTSLFANAPKLTRTYLMDHEAWRINWSSVTTIHLCDLELLEEVIATLKQTERLEELNLFGVHDDIPCTTAPVRLPYLKILYCGTVDLLLLFIAPELEELSIRHEFETPAEIEPAICKFFKISHRLRKLKLYTDFPEVVRMVFQHIPAVQELFLYGFEIPKQLRELSKLPKARELNAITLGFRSEMEQQPAASVLSKI